MFSLPANAAIYLHTEPTDMRRGFEGLSGVIRGQFGSDPQDGSLFLFVNRRKDRIEDLALGWNGLLDLLQAPGSRDLRVAEIVRRTRRNRYGTNGHDPGGNSLAQRLP